jgi:hypothetical protein
VHLCGQSGARSRGGLSRANDVTARRDLGSRLGRLGLVDLAPDGVAESLASLEEAHKLIEPIASANSKSAETANQVALILEYEGHRRRTMGHNDEAIARYRKSIALLQPLFDQQNESVTNPRLVIMQPLWNSLTGHSRKRKSIAAANFRDLTYECPLQRRLGPFLFAPKAGMTNQARQSAEIAMIL